MCCEPLNIHSLIWSSSLEARDGKGIFFFKDTKCNFTTMAKAAKKKSPKKASNIFHNIMAASVSGNPKPNPSKKKTNNEGQ